MQARNVRIYPILWKSYGLPTPVAEYRFAPPRRWRADWCFVEAKLIVECQGGLFTGGRHVRGAALTREYEKLNRAAILGYRVLFVTPADLRTFRVFELVRQALGIS